MREKKHEKIGGSHRYAKRFHLRRAFKLGYGKNFAGSRGVRKRADEQGAEIVFTRDTHDENYAQTQEGRKLPVPHCVKNTKGWQIAEALSDYVQNVFDKYTFGSLLLAQYALDNQFDCIDLVGVCTDICVISNALLLKAFLPEAEINVVESCCAGVTPERHRNAIEAMRACQINII